MKKIVVLIFVLFVSGCASIPKDAPPYSPAPLASDNSAILYIYRIGAHPKLRTPSVLIDDQKIIDPPENAYTWVYLSSGLHKVTVDWAWDTGWPDLDFEIPIESGKEHFLKITGSFETLGLKYRMGSKAMHVEKDIAENELRSCCKYIRPANKKIHPTPKNGATD